jgi:DNA-binding LacI/PurR family transcriptional regulator
MTASVVLNGARSFTRVSEETRARVVEAASGLRCRRNAGASCLSRRLMVTVGVVAVVDEAEVNLHFLEILNGVLEGAAAFGRNTTIFSLRDWKQDQARLLRVQTLIPQVRSDARFVLPPPAREIKGIRQVPGTLTALFPSDLVVRGSAAPPCHGDDRWPASGPG